MERQLVSSFTTFSNFRNLLSYHHASADKDTSVVQLMVSVFFFLFLFLKHMASNQYTARPGT